MNNDTPQIFGEDAHDHAPDAGSFPEHDGEAFPAFHGVGWGDCVEPVAPDDDYPQPSFSPYEPSSYEPSSYQAEYPQPPGPGQPGYPRVRAMARLGYARRLVYPQDPGEDRDLDYPPDGNARAGTRSARRRSVPGRDAGSGQPLGYAEDPGYARDLGFVRDAELVPVTEPLPDPQEHADAPARRGPPVYWLPPVHEVTPAHGVTSLRTPPLGPRKCCPGKYRRRRRSLHRSTCGVSPTT